MANNDESASSRSNQPIATHKLQFAIKVLSITTEITWKIPLVDLHRTHLHHSKVESKRVRFCSTACRQFVISSISLLYRIQFTQRRFAKLNAVFCYSTNLALAVRTTVLFSVHQIIKFLIEMTTALTVESAKLKLICFRILQLVIESEATALPRVRTFNETNHLILINILD